MSSPTFRAPVPQSIRLICTQTQPLRQCPCSIEVNWAHHISQSRAAERYVANLGTPSMVTIDVFPNSMSAEAESVAGEGIFNRVQRKRSADA